MLSGQVSLYQTVSVPLLEAVKVCAIVLSPLVGLVEPARPQYVPPWHPELTTEAVPAAVQPESEPVSKLPLVRSFVTGALTVSVTVVVWVAEVPVPVTVIG